MSAKMMMNQPEADNGFGLLKDIVAMVKNPDAIDEAYERRRKAAELTDGEVAAAADARALIAQGDALRDELKKREDSIEAAKTEHNGNVLAHIENARKENTRLQEWEDRLRDTENKQADITAKQDEREATLATRAEEIENQRLAREQQDSARSDVISQTEDAQKTENDRLVEWAAKLKAKAARLAAEAQSDG